MQTQTSLMTELSQENVGISDTANFALDVAKGLSQSPKTLPSRYFYDGIGSKLFQQIMNLPEYYLTNCEYEAFINNKQEIAEQFGAAGFFHLIDLGAGDALKTKILLRQLYQDQRNFEYVPIDISGDAMRELNDSLNQELPDMQVHTVVGEYFQALEWLYTHKTERKIVLLLGSNIGNFAPAESIRFLQSIKSYLQPGDKLLIGVDLRKEPETILQAYNDSSGVTAAFNLNLLLRINRELGGEFDLDTFQHYALYNPQEGVMKSYLVSKINQEVQIRDTQSTYKFTAWEAIQTESSYKYSLQQIDEMAKKCGFKLESIFQDEKKYFADVLFSVS